MTMTKIQKQMMSLNHHPQLELQLHRRCYWLFLCRMLTLDRRYNQNHFYYAIVFFYLAQNYL